MAIIGFFTGGIKTMRESINEKQFDEERALYHLQNADVVNCSFAGPADGESALKEELY